MEEKNKQTNKEDSLSKMRAERRKQRRIINTVTVVYIGVALCMALVLAVSFVSTKKSVDDAIGSISDISISVPDISFPDISVPNIPDSSMADNPVGGTVSDVDDTVIKDEESKEPVVVTPKFVKPVDGKIIKPFSVDALVFSETMQDFRVHGGIDIGCAEGSRVCAYTDGRIVTVENDAFMGTTVTVEHSAGVKTVYSNLSAVLPDTVYTGAPVSAGDVIGTVGSTAIVESSDAPHLHFEVWLDGERLDPAEQIDLG